MLRKLENGGAINFICLCLYTRITPQNNVLIQQKSMKPIYRNKTIPPPLDDHISIKQNRSNARIYCIAFET